MNIVADLANSLYKEGEKDFYRRLIATADKRYTAHIASIRKTAKVSKKAKD